jgi:hypothetical protein
MRTGGQGPMPPQTAAQAEEQSCPGPQGVVRHPLIVLASSCHNASNAAILIASLTVG